MRRKAILIALVAIVAAAMFMGCIEEETPLQPHTSVPEIGYQIGDVIMKESAYEGQKLDYWLILEQQHISYPSYKIVKIYKVNDSWAFYSDESSSDYHYPLKSRIAEDYPIKVDYIDVSTIPYKSDYVDVNPPKFKKGDVVGYSDLEWGRVIIEYNEGSNEYITVPASPESDGWEVDITRGGRWSFDKVDLEIILGYIKKGYISKIDEYDFSNVSTVYKPKKKVSLPKEGVYVRVEYFDKWSGSVASEGSSRSVDGDGTENIYISSDGGYVISAFIQKQEDNGCTLTVKIIKDGEVIKSESTTAAYGVVSVSCWV